MFGRARQSPVVGGHAAWAGRGSARSSEPPAQSPTMIAGLRRIATSLWLHFVASPQRMPGISHRRRGRPVVDVIDRAPPRSLSATTSALSRGSNPGGASGCGTTCPRKPTPTTTTLSTSTDPQLTPPTRSDYAESERVSSSVSGSGSARVVGMRSEQMSARVGVLTTTMARRLETGGGR